MIRVGDILYKEKSGRLAIVYDIIHQMVWYKLTSKYGIWNGHCRLIDAERLKKITV